MRLRLKRLSQPSVVLHYHSVASLEPEDDPHNLAVPASRLRAHLDALRGRGYEFVTVTEFAARLGGRKPRPGMCSLTFDDGTVDNLEALPAILAEHDACATVFVCPGLAGRPHPDYASHTGIRFMNEGELRQLAAIDSVEIGSHTLAHTELAAATAEEAYAEMVTSKEHLEELLGQPITSFAYPSCAYSPPCPDAARRAGYSVAVTCGFLGSWNPHELGRESVSSLDGRILFELRTRRLWKVPRQSVVGRAVAWLRRRRAAGRHR